jgi:MFS family permease
VPFWLLGLPAGAMVDRLRPRQVMVACDVLQAAAFSAIATLAAAGRLSFPGLLALVGVSGCATVFFQVASNSYLPELFTDPRDLQRGNARLFLSESLARSLGPMSAGPVIALVGITAAIAANAGTFAVSVVSLLAIRHRVGKRMASPREPGWLRRDIRSGLRFVRGNPYLEPVIACGTVYALFLSMVEASIVLYGRGVLGLGSMGIGAVVGGAALGFPVGSGLSGRLVDRLGIPRTLVTAACVAVTGLVAMPVAGSLGSVAGLVGAGVVQGMGQGAFGPTSLTLRQTETPAGLLGRVNAVNRVLIWGAIPLGSLLAAATIRLAGLETVLWVGGLGTTMCLPVLLRRGLRASLRSAASPTHPQPDPISAAAGRKSPHHDR